MTSQIDQIINFINNHVAIIDAQPVEASVTDTGRTKKPVILYKSHDRTLDMIQFRCCDYYLSIGCFHRGHRYHEKINLGMKRHLTRISDVYVDKDEFIQILNDNKTEFEQLDLLTT